ncbi:MAG: AraC family transcriptional regulator [Verrucomicrobiota bacterium JB022]|nr:AraC family transcriptional regulator [Verrucomicrobiota bacterium JB022]
MQSVKTALFRPSPSPQRPLPLPVRSVGHYRLHGDQPEAERQRWVYEFFWGLEGAGSFQVEGGEWLRLEPGEVFLYQPGDWHRIRQETPYWEYRWLTCDGHNTGQWLRELGIAERKFKAGPCPQDLFERLHERILDNTPTGEGASSALAYEILLRALPSHAATFLPASPIYQIRSEIDARFMDSNLSISRLAHKHGLHRTTLYRQFQAAFGVAPVAYVRNRRVQKALSLLKETALPMAEVAALSGFNDETYFSNVILKTVGVRPSTFRRKG